MSSRMFALLVEPCAFVSTKRKLKVEARSLEEVEQNIATALAVKAAVSVEVFDKDFDEWVPLHELAQLEEQKGKIRLVSAGSIPERSPRALKKTAAAPTEAEGGDTAGPGPAADLRATAAPPVASEGAAEAMEAADPDVAMAALTLTPANSEDSGGAGAAGEGATGGGDGAAKAAPRAIHVRVHMGKDLQDVQTFGAQDPYVKVALLPMAKDPGAAAAQTGLMTQTLPVVGGGVCPHWDDPLEYNTKLALNLVPGATAVAIEVWNLNTVMDDVIGTTQLKLPFGSKSTAGPKWYDLRPCGQLLCTVYEAEAARDHEHVREEERSIWDRMMST